MSLKSFDWYTKTSPLSGLGGLKGASTAYDMLLESIGRKRGETEDRQTLQNFVIGTEKSQAS
jgi:hypothetical protein